MLQEFSGSAWQLSPPLKRDCSSVPDLPLPGADEHTSFRQRRNRPGPLTEALQLLLEDAHCNAALELYLDGGYPCGALFRRLPAAAALRLSTHLHDLHLETDWYTLKAQGFEVTQGRNRSAT